MSIPIAQDIVIIGAGLSGLILALSLHAEGIPCTIYDLRVPNRPAGGALMLAPNALRILDSLNLYGRLKPLGFSFERLRFLNEDYELTGSYDFGIPTKHGYQALRIYRDVLISEIEKVAAEHGILIHYGTRFSHVVSADPDKGVTFAFADGTTRTASLLIGADGINSTVRTHVDSDIKPKYSGMCAAVGAVDRASITFPPGVEESFDQAVTVQGSPGAMVMAPQMEDGQEFMIGTQFPVSEEVAMEWKAWAVGGQKEKLAQIMRRDEDRWTSEVVKTGLKGLKRHTLNIWAYYMIPRLDRWASTDERVVLVGDGAHAIPPTIGQGATQGLEDVFSFAMLLGRLPRGAAWGKALKWWQEMRQGRVDRVLNLTTRMNNARASKEERDKLPADPLWQTEEEEDLGWLYNFEIKDAVVGWIQEHRMAGKAQET